MAYKFKAWGLDGSLSHYTDFYNWNGNGVQQVTSTVDPAVVDDRADVVTLDGYPALRMRRYAGDPLAGSGRRTELVPNEYSQIYDWVGEGVGGASVDNAVRWYRYCFMVPSGFPLSYLSTTQGVSHVIFGQLHQVADTSPADTQGLGPALSINATVDAYGKYWFTITRNVDPTDTVTVLDYSVHAKNVVRWPLRFDVWQDVMIQTRWAYSSNGYCTVYLDRRPIFVEASGVSCPNNSPARGGSGNYPKMGIYTSADVDMTLYHRGLIVGDHEATFADMYPELDGAVPLERVSGPSSARGY